MMVAAKPELSVGAWQPRASRFIILSWFPLRLSIGVGYCEGTHVEAGFPLDAMTWPIC